MFKFFASFLFFALFIAESLFAVKGEGEIDSFFNYNEDYSIFSARVTDKDSSGHVLKLQSKTKNIRFLKVGDFLPFKISENLSKKYCRSYVKNNEEAYIVIYVEDIKTCWGNQYFRRGTKLYFNAKILAKRVRDASIYRRRLLKRRKNYYNQLNDLNHFVWSYDQKKIQLAASYDKKIIEVKKKKQKTLDSLVSKKREKLVLRRELSRHIDLIERDLKFYRVENDEKLDDPWSLDHGLSYPVTRRPKQRQL